MDKDRIALALSVMSRRLKFDDMDSDELVMLGFERVFNQHQPDKDMTAAHVHYCYDKRDAIEMAEAIILEAITSNEKGN